MMKETELTNLLDKAIGTKGNLRIPSYWMRRCFGGLMEWAKGLTSKIDVPTKMSELENDAGLATQSYVNAKATEQQNYTSSSLESVISNITQVLIKDISYDLYLYLSRDVKYGDAPAFVVNGNMLPEDATIIFADQRLYGGVYKWLTVAKNVTFTRGDYVPYDLDPNSFTSDQYYLSEFTFLNVSGSKLVIQRNDVCPVGFLTITPKNAEGCRCLVLKHSQIGNGSRFYITDGRHYLLNSLDFLEGSLPKYTYTVGKVVNIFASENDLLNAKSVEVSEGAEGVIINTTLSEEVSIILPSTIKEVFLQVTHVLTRAPFTSFVDFRKLQTIPVVPSTLYLADGVKVIVPDALYDDWIVADMWSDFAGNIIKASEYDG